MASGYASSDSVDIILPKTLVLACGSKAWTGLTSSEDEHVFDPAPIPFFRDTEIVQVAAGAEHSLFLSRTGQVFAVGSNTYGQCGQEEETSALDEPKAVLLPSSVVIVQISAGHYMSAFLTSDGKVYYCGRNDIGYEHTFVPRIEGMLASSRVVQVSCGESHILYLLQDGSVYARGLGRDGQLGLGAEDDKEEPACVRALTGAGVIQLSAGEGYSFALTVRGEVYAFGSGNYGKLGTGTTANVHAPVRLSAFDGIRVTSVCAGASHSLFLTEEGHVLGCGSNKNGRIGMADSEDACNEDVLKPVHISPTFFSPSIKINPLTGQPIALDESAISRSALRRSQRVTQVSAGIAHSAFVTEAGNVYVVGKADRGRLGLGKPSGITVPRVLTPHSLLLPVEKAYNPRVACGGSHTIVALDLEAPKSPTPSSPYDLFLTEQEKRSSDIFISPMQYSANRESLGDSSAPPSYEAGAMLQDPTAHTLIAASCALQVGDLSGSELRQCEEAALRVVANIRLERTLRNNPLGNLCLNCRSLPSSVLLHPCSHVAICQTCVNFMSSCPSCQTPITAKHFVSPSAAIQPNSPLS